MFRVRVPGSGSRFAGEPRIANPDAAVESASGQGTWNLEPHRGHESAPGSREPGLPAAVLFIAVVAWPAFVFGGVYPWVYAVTGVLAALFAVLAITAGGWRVEPAVTAAALATLAAVAVQLIPLPIGVVSWISPPTAAFLESHDVGYALARLAGQNPPHPLSIDPAATWRFILFFVTVCLVFAGVRALGAVRSLRFVVPAVTLLGAALAAIGLVQSGVDRERLYGIWAPETAAAVFGPFVNRNHFAAFMLMALPVAMTQCAAHARRMRRQAASSRIVELMGTPAASQALLSGFAAVLMSVALVTTRSRSGLAGFVVVLAGVFVLIAARRRTPSERIVAALLVVALAAGVTAWVGWGRLVARFDELPGSRLSGRVDAWSEGLRIAGAFWPAGSGMNTYSSAMLAYHDPSVELYFRTPHNDYLQAFTDGGLLVGLPLVALLVVLARQLTRTLRASATWSSFDAWTRGGAAAGLAAVALQEVVDFSLQTPANAVLFAALAAYVMAAPSASRAPAPSRRGRSRSGHERAVQAGGVR